MSATTRDNDAELRIEHRRAAGCGRTELAAQALKATASLAPVNGTDGRQSCSDDGKSGIEEAVACIDHSMPCIHATPRCSRGAFCRTRAPRTLIDEENLSTGAAFRCSRGAFCCS